MSRDSIQGVSNAKCLITIIGKMHTLSHRPNACKPLFVKCTLAIKHPVCSKVIGPNFLWNLKLCNVNKQRIHRTTVYLPNNIFDYWSWIKHIENYFSRIENIPISHNRHFPINSSLYSCCLYQPMESQTKITRRFIMTVIGLCTIDWSPNGSAVKIKCLAISFVIFDIVLSRCVHPI